MIDGHVEPAALFWDILLLCDVVYCRGFVHLQHELAALRNPGGQHRPILCWLWLAALRMPQLKVDTRVLVLVDCLGFRV